MSPALFSSASSEWSTPQELFDNLNREFHFTLDVCATAENAKCSKFFTKEDNGLSRGWGTETCWMNPPYGRGMGAWIEKAYRASLGGATVVCLLPSRTDTRWFHEYVLEFGETRFVRGRLKFGTSKNSAPFPSVIVVFRAWGGMGDDRDEVRN